MTGKKRYSSVQSYLIFRIEITARTRRARRESQRLVGCAASGLTTLVMGIEVSQARWLSIALMGQNVGTPAWVFNLFIWLAFRYFVHDEAGGLEFLQDSLCVEKIEVD